MPEGASPALPTQPTEGFAVGAESGARPGKHARAELVTVVERRAVRRTQIPEARQRGERGISPHEGQRPV
jgi:hypothetical protein